ncbi:pyruvate:ferredoxin oxidoreductase and related 2-oxoacid:ferredoxin oxidoreductases, alpha subunit [Pelotomaculum thermopropionicum SI]|uniref:Pyruvate:ferredoxin oxidoreductase and related 2-oxoacid:ferredoxin oxidoreductases, alpha subunit n=1 Tax=Pelotomaculum thermopropionicum (strain DSM 13744 / JCM 10971 / SI) TaxID=370438 RepID=A5D424_PELTS|nr:pyruvate:ferredoxin oxidoreductase and related 2-oxoacid:ferredoxin oxidoreductases, alpha subunit [Pelotomaculum thermopropionicum SI]
MNEVLPLARLMQGNEAIAEGALAAGARFFAGYPITPSTEIAEILAEKLPLLGGRFIQMEDEIASMAAVIGASLAGIKSLTATSGPGFSLKQENIGFAVIAEIPCVVVNVQRYGPSTGIPTAPAQGDVMQARWGTHGDHPAIALCPASVQEAFTLTVQAFNLSEKFRTPVILLTDEVIGHLRERVVLPGPGELPVINRKKPPAGLKVYYPYRPDADGVPPMANFCEGYRYHVTGLVHDESGFPSTSPDVAERLMIRLNNKIMNNLDEIILTESFLTEDAEIAVIAYGAVSRSARRAVKEARAAGIKVGLFRPVTIWPFPEREVAELSGRVRALLVPEMNLGQLKLEVERSAGHGAKVAGLCKVNGELITPGEILEAIRQL